MNTLYTKGSLGEPLALARATFTRFLANDTLVAAIQEDAEGVVLVMRDHTHRISRADYLRLTALPLASAHTQLSDGFAYQQEPHQQSPEWRTWLSIRLPFLRRRGTTGAIGEPHADERRES